MKGTGNGNQLVSFSASYEPLKKWLEKVRSCTDIRLKELVPGDWRRAEKMRALARDENNTDDERFKPSYGRTIYIGSFESVRIDLSKGFYENEITIEKPLEKVRGELECRVKKIIGEGEAR